MDGLSHEAVVKADDLFNAGVARVAGAACVGVSALCEELHVLFLDDALEVSGDADVGGELLDRVDSGLTVLLLNLII